MQKADHKDSNEILRFTSQQLGDRLGGSACTSCTDSYCCEFQHEVGISTKEFDSIEHLVTPIHIARAEVEADKQEKSTYNGKHVYRCPFLSLDGKCEIYDQRFIVCSMYSVIGETSADCSRDNEGGTVPMVNVENVIHITMGVPSVNTRFRTYVHNHTDVLEEFKERYLECE